MIVYIHGGGICIAKHCTKEISNSFSFSTLVAGSDFAAISNFLTFASGSSMGPPPAQQCTNVSISDDTLLEDEFETVPLTLSSADSDVTFIVGGNSATISIQDDESELLPCKHVQNAVLANWLCYMSVIQRSS